MHVRFLDLGTVPYLRSQTTYHAIAYAMEEGSPNVISMMVPDRPYFCIGFHQDLQKEIDLDYCRRHDLPVLRREVGGGAVYLDGGQTFVHFIFHRRQLPRNVEEVYRLFIRPMVETYRALGIPASHRPVNDIVVRERKIGGTGIASIGDALVFATSFMFGFDTKTMSRGLRVSSEKMRDKIVQGLEGYMTTMVRELGEAPPREKVKAIFADKVRETLEVDPEPSDLTTKERQIAARLDRRFASRRWLYQKGILTRSGILIKGGVTVAEADHKAPGGLIRVTALLKDGVIDRLSISGDFTFQPAPALEQLEGALKGRPLERDALLGSIESFYAVSQVQSPGVTPADIAEALLALTG